MLMITSWSHDDDGAKQYLFLAASALLLLVLLSFLLLCLACYGLITSHCRDDDELSPSKLLLLKAYQPS